MQGLQVVDHPAIEEYLEPSCVPPRCCCQPWPRKVPQWMEVEVPYDCCTVVDFCQDGGSLFGWNVSQRVRSGLFLRLGNCRAPIEGVSNLRSCAIKKRWIVCPIPAISMRTGRSCPSRTFSSYARHKQGERPFVPCKLHVQDGMVVEGEQESLPCVPLIIRHMIIKFAPVFANLNGTRPLRLKIPAQRVGGLQRQVW